MNTINNKATSIRWRILAILILASFVSYVLRYNLSTAAPAMMEDLALSVIEWGWILAAFNIGYALFQIPGGVMGDRLGPRRALTIIAIMWGVLTLATTLIPGQASASHWLIIGSLMAVRFLVGVAHAPIFPVVNSSVVRWFPKGSWGLPAGLSSTGLTLGVAASAPILAWTVPTYGWRMSFVFLTPIAFIVAALWWWYSRDDPAKHDSVNQAEVALIMQGRESDTEEVGSWLQVVKDRNVLLLTLSYACMSYTYYIVFNWFFFYLVEIREFSLGDAGWVTAAQWISGAIGAALGGWLCDRLCRRYGLKWGCRWPIVIGMVASGALLVAGAINPNPSVAVAMLALCFFFNQTVEGPYWAASIAIGDKQAGAAGGVMNTGGNGMGAVNAVLVAWIATAFGWTFAIAMGAVFAIVGAGLILLVDADQTVDAKN